MVVWAMIGEFLIGISLLENKLMLSDKTGAVIAERRVSRLSAERFYDLLMSVIEEAK